MRETMEAAGPSCSTPMPPRAWGRWATSCASFPSTLFRKVCPPTLSCAAFLSTPPHIHILYLPTRHTPVNTLVHPSPQVAVDVRALGVDMATVVGHKFGAPKGVAALYIRCGGAVHQPRGVPRVGGRCTYIRCGCTSGAGGAVHEAVSVGLRTAEGGPPSHRPQKQVP